MMRNSIATLWKKWRTNRTRIALALLSFAGVGLPNGQAQLEYNGGFVQTHREDGGQAPRLAAAQRGARSALNTPPSYFPDQDFYYPWYYSPRASGLRLSSSYYYAAEPSGRTLLAPERKLPQSVAAASLPWNRVGFRDYDERREMSRESSRKFSLTTIPLPQAAPAERPEVVVLIAHLPEHALFWVQGTPTRSTGRARYFQSPPLLPGRKYNYRVRAAWIENGRWVSQTREIPVQAGLIQAIYLQAK